MSYDYYGWYEPTRPKEVKGGIKAQSRRGAFAHRWWSKRWIQTLEDFHIGARLNRGRSYARKGQVATLDIAKGSVCAEVQGSELEPYQVKVKFKVFTEGQWEAILEKLLESPIFAAQLLGKEMPQDIESIFQDAGLSLFPNGGDLEADCSCPDWSNPCKHIAAVFYLMAEAFDHDPFLIFTLRGMEKDEVFKSIREKEGYQKDKKPGIEPESLPSDADRFWQNDQGFGPEFGFVPPGLHAAVAKRLGPVPFWRSKRDFMGHIEEKYKRSSEYAKKLFEQFFYK